MITVGVNVHPAWNEQSDPAVRATIRAEMVRMGATAVRIDFAWATIEPQQGQWSWGKLDTFVNEYAGDGLKVLLMLYSPPGWASVGGQGGKNAVPENPADFGRVCGEAAKRYGSKLAGIELWNEPDLDTFWTGTSTQFADLLAGAYPVAKQLAPATTFLAAAPTYLGLASGWFEAMYASGRYGPGTTHDAQAIHPYPSPSDLPPNAPASDWSINGIPNLQQLRTANGDTSPLWVTEVGYSTHDSPDDAENWKRGISEQEQAAYTLGTLIMLDRYDIAACYLYTDRDMAQTSEPHERNFGLMRVDNSSKPVVDLLATVLHAGPPEPPDPEEPGPDPELEARVTALEARVTALEAQDAELAANFQEAANDLA